MYELKLISVLIGQWLKLKGLADLVESNGVEFDLTHNGRDYRVVEAINDNLQNKTITIRVELLK